MQKILNLSKFVLLLAISSSLLLVWYSNEIEVIHLVPTYTDTSDTDSYREEATNTSIALTTDRVSTANATTQGSTTPSTTTPVTPVITPATPVITPATPVITPATPVITAGARVMTHAAPVVTRAAPVITRTAPVITRAAPVITRVAPVISPTPSVTPPTTASTKDAISSPGNSSNIWDTLRSEFRLDTRTQSPQVQAEIRKLLAEPNKLSNIFKASVPYIYFIHQQVLHKGLPAELALIPVIESEFNPNDVSTVGATGLWQFMAPTARELGIKVRSGYDGRRNVIASTKAALAYFKDLGILFKGNWYLAIAAYNCGQGKVMSVMRKTGSNNFWNLPLPQETKLYVPRLLAVAAIVKNPEKYGVTLPKTVNKPYFAEVKVSKSVNIHEVAKSSGVNIDTLNKLNPDYTRGNHPKQDASTFLVPVAHEQAVINSLTA